MTPRLYSLFALIIIVVNVFAKDVRKLCTSSLGNKSCGQCIKQHPECAWCLDPHLTGSSRCDLMSEFKGKCNPSLIYSPTTEVRITPQNNLPLGSKHADGATIVQLEPQQVVLRMKPGRSIFYRSPPVFSRFRKKLVLISRGSAGWPSGSPWVPLGGAACPPVMAEGDLACASYFALFYSHDDIRYAAPLMDFCFLGDILEVPFKYLHRPQQQSQRDFVIQTSEFRSLGVGIEFSIICGGKRVQGRQCPNVQIGDRIEFFAKVSLNECKSSGDIAISIGAYGYQTVSAMYITPFCGCDCEKVQNQERRSPLCYGAGDLICGVCECQPGKGGNHCECDLHQYGVSSAQELENKCRKSPNDLICSGNGQCRCGRCVCNVEHVHGDYCECEGMSCPTFEGRLCAGQGECSCGKCRCEEGYTGDDCSCITDTAPCVEGGRICNGQGTCECGKCVCYEGFTGLTCGIAKESEVIDKESPKSQESMEYGHEKQQQPEDEEGGKTMEEKGHELDDVTGENEEGTVEDVDETKPKSFEDDEGHEKEEMGGGETDEHGGEEEMVEDHEKKESGSDSMKDEDGEVLPPAEEDETDSGGEAAGAEEAGEESTPKPVHEGQTAAGSSLRIEGSLLILLVTLIFFWP